MYEQMMVLKLFTGDQLFTVRVLYIYETGMSSPAESTEVGRRPT